MKKSDLPQKLKDFLDSMDLKEIGVSISCFDLPFFDILCFKKDYKYYLVLKYYNFSKEFEIYFSNSRVRSIPKKLSYNDGPAVINFDKYSEIKY